MQYAILCFRDYQGNDLISGVSQLENEGTHINLDGANDFVGRGANDRVDLLAPYDCKVMAIATYDNTVFFQSLDKVMTPSGEYNHCWFMCCHILDSDFRALGLKVGRVFKQGEPCYTEGKKGIGSGYHIHMEQGYGVFGGGSSPYYKSSDTFIYNGKVYAQYYPVLGKNSKECHIADMMFIDKDVEVVRGKNGKGLPDYYDMKEVEDMSLVKFKLDKENYEYKWSVDGNKYGEDFDITTERGFADLELEKQGWELLLKVNGSLFYTYDDSHYACGLERSRGITNQDVSMSCVSDYNDCMAIAGVGEELYFASQKWIIDKKLDESYCAITGLGLILDGKKRNDLHKGFESQWNTKSGRTVIGEDKYGNPMSYSFAGETGKSGLTGSQLQDKCLELGFHNAILLDGGGSVFRQYRNDLGELTYDISSSRKVKNALLLYRRKKTIENTNIDELKNTYEVVLKANQELKEKYDSLQKEHSLTLESINHLKESVLNAIKTIEDILNE